MSHTVTRYHDISVGHRVVGHESKCRHLHGHNYRIHFEVAPEDGLDQLGRVLDFGVVKEKLCVWVEENWDHKFLAWEEDLLLKAIYYEMPGRAEFKDVQMLQESVVFVPFNPTAENMAEHLVEIIGPVQLSGTGCALVRCSIEETRKCSCTYERN